MEFITIESLISALGGEVKQKNGSRVRIDLNGYSLNIHSPHPQKEVKIYVVKLLREFLEKARYSMIYKKLRSTNQLQRRRRNFLRAGR